MMSTNTRKARLARTPGVRFILAWLSAVLAALAIVIASALMVGNAAEQPWTGELRGGGEVYVDPSTRRPTVRRNGQETQLWDGVHQLEGGRELRVESGRVVPNEEILETSEPWPEPAMPSEPGPPVDGRSPCERLVRKVCGPDGGCAEAAACDPARQLWDMEREEQRRLGTPERQTFTSNKCIEALGDDFFAPCAAPGAEGGSAASGGQ